MSKYNFAVRQDSDGYWEYFDSKDGFVLGGGYLTCEESEREAQWFMDYMNQRDEIIDQIKEKMLSHLAAWDGHPDSIGASGTILDRDDVRVAIRLGVDDAMDALLPRG